MKTLSICIPTLNRKCYLMLALHSILKCSKQLSRVEVCISNNCSEENYEEIEQLVSSYSFIKYVKHTRRLSLDENMHFCVKMAVGEYIYYLGDDDFFLDNGIAKLLEIVDNEFPDLVVLNGLNVDEFGAPIGKLFSCTNTVLKTFNDAYSFYNDKCSFGAVLVKRKHLNDAIFEKFYGTSHAYMCFWASLAIQSEAKSDDSIKVMTPIDSIVALRQADKTYRDYLLDVFYEHMPHWYTVLQSFIQGYEMKNVVSRCADSKIGYTFRMQFITSLKLDGVDIRKIKSYPSARVSCNRLLKLSIIWLVPISILRFIRKLKKYFKHMKLYEIGVYQKDKICEY